VNPTRGHDINGDRPVYDQVNASRASERALRGRDSHGGPITVFETDTCIELNTQSWKRDVILTYGRRQTSARY